MRRRDFRGWRSPRFWPRKEYGRWTKDVFDRGLLLYLRLANQAGTPIAPSKMWGITSDMEEFDCYTTRMMANAARAIAYGMGSMSASDPPPLYRSTTAPVASQFPLPRTRPRLFPPTAVPSRTGA